LAGLSVLELTPAAVAFLRIAAPKHRLNKRCFLLEPAKEQFCPVDKATRDVYFCGSFESKVRGLFMEKRA